MNVELAEYRTWGDYARALAAGEVPAATIDVMDRIMLDGEMAARDRLVDHRRALADAVTGNVAGILPPAWLTNIVDYIGTARPLISAFSSAPLPPSGMTVNFPQVTVRPSVAKQATQKTQVSSTATTIVAGSANVNTYGGGEDVSVQTIQRTDPSYLAIVNELYAEQMSVAEDTDACTTVVAAVPVGTANNLTLSLATNGSDINKQLAAAGKQILSVRGNFDTFVMDLNLWAYVVGAADTTGRPLFPDNGPMNPVGSSAVNVATGEARGLMFVADPNMPANTGVAGDSRAFTSLLGGVQTLRVDNPAQLGVDFAVFEFAAWAVRRPSALVKFTLGA
jgi:HK97 family phage major capsid protein